MRPPKKKAEKKNCQWTKKIKDADVYGWGRQIFPKSPKENKNSLKCQLRVYLRKLIHNYAFRESARKPRESIEALNMDSRSGQYEGFQTSFFQINLSPDFGYEAPRRGLLLWPLKHSMQSSPTPYGYKSIKTFWVCC